jgi:predicted small lipoprotein YifL
MTMNKRMKTITRATLAALAMLALAGCSEPAYVPTQEDIEAEIEAARDALLDAQQRIDDAKTGAVWAWDTVSPAREAAPLKAEGDMGEDQGR